MLKYLERECVFEHFRRNNALFRHLVTLGRQIVQSSSVLLQYGGFYETVECEARAAECLAKFLRVYVCEKMA